VYRKNLIVATEGRSFWVVDALPVLQQLKAGLESTTAALFKPADAYRQGGPLPTFYYWFKDKPAAPVTIEVKDSKGAVSENFINFHGEGLVCGITISTLRGP